MDHADHEWHKSTYSGGSNECVEVCEHLNGVDVRDTGHRELDSLGFQGGEWAAFVRDVKDGAL